MKKINKTKKYLHNWIRDEYEQLSHMINIVEHENKECYRHLPNATLDTNVKNWYVAAFPSKLFADNIGDDMTFNDVYVILKNKNAYNRFDCEESILRERIFRGLCIALNRDYDFVYNMWLDNVEEN